MGAMNKKTFLIAASLSALLLSGCGPGFPIMTREQEDLIVNVEKLMKENDSLKARVGAVEGSGGIDALKRDMESVKRSVAEANIGLERLSQDLASVKGGLEEGGAERASVKEAAKEAEELASSLKASLASMEASLAANQGRLSAIETADQGRDRTLAEMKEALSRLESRASSLEKGASASPQPEAKTAGEDPEKLYQKGYNETISRDYPRAISSFQKFLDSFPGHKLAVNAQYWLGEIYYARGDWEVAILEFDKVIKKYPDTEKAPASLLKQAFAFEKLGSTKEAAVLLQEVVDKYPKSPEASMAKKRLASITAK